MDILAWLIFGLIAGYIAHLVDPKTVKGGLLGTLVLGVLGALLGGFLSNTLFGVGISGFNITSLVIAILGALLLSFLYRAYMRRVY